jgi:uncharacterized protein YukE
MKELLQEYSQIRNSVEKNEADIKEAKERLAQLDELILEAMVNAGQQNCAGEDGRKFFRKTERWVSAADNVDKKEMIRVLANDPDFADLVTAQVNSMSLRTRYQEVLDSGAELSPEVAKVLKVSESVKLGTRK